MRSDPAPTAPALSIVIPAYNERERLPSGLTQIRDYLAQRPDLRAEVIVVDDGSTDGTLELVRDAAREWPALRAIALPGHAGKGAAVRAGLAATRGATIAFSDADVSATIWQLDALLSDLRDAEVAIVSRALPGAQLARRQSRPRELLGRVYAAVAQLLLLRGVPDAHCGLKAFRGDFGRDLFDDVTETGVLFDIEALLLATLRGGRISQRPAIWSHDPRSRIRFDVRKFADVLGGLLRLKLRYRLALAARAHGPIRTAVSLPPPYPQARREPANPASHTP